MKSLYVKIHDGKIENTQKLEEGNKIVNIDRDAFGEIVGIEVITWRSINIRLDGEDLLEKIASLEERGQSI